VNGTLMPELQMLSEVRPVTVGAVKRLAPLIVNVMPHGREGLDIPNIVYI
jgi:hypothetical protein